VGQILIGETKKNVGLPKPKYSAWHLKERIDAFLSVHF
jgi:hypothetical protein